jgi:hypothetical protein
MCASPGAAEAREPQPETLLTESFSPLSVVCGLRQPGSWASEFRLSFAGVVLRVAAGLAGD